MERLQAATGDDDNKEEEEEGGERSNRNTIKVGETISEENRELIIADEISPGLCLLLFSSNRTVSIWARRQLEQLCQDAQTSNQSLGSTVGTIIHRVLFLSACSLGFTHLLGVLVLPSAASDMTLFSTDMWSGFAFLRTNLKFPSVYHKLLEKSELWDCAELLVSTYIQRVVVDDDRDAGLNMAEELSSCISFLHDCLCTDATSQSSQLNRIRAHSQKLSKPLKQLVAVDLSDGAVSKVVSVCVKIN